MINRPYVWKIHLLLVYVDYACLTNLISLATAQMVVSRWSQHSICVCMCLHTCQPETGPTWADIILRIISNYHLSLRPLWDWFSQSQSGLEERLELAYLCEGWCARQTLHIPTSKRKRVISYDPRLTSQVSYPTGARLVTSLLLDLSPMRHTHTFGNSELRIDGQIPGRILDVGDWFEAFEFRNGHLGIVKGEMTMNRSRRWYEERKRTEKSKVTGWDEARFSQEATYSETGCSVWE